MKRIFVAVVGLALVLTGCGTNVESQPGPTTTVEVEATNTPVEAATTVVPGMPTGLCMGDCVVTDFAVWQDFMPSIPQTGAPLHATFTLEITWPEKITVANTHGTITILRANGDQIVTSGLQLNQQVDDNGLMQPGPQSVSFSMVPAPVSTQLTEGEMLHGTAALTIGDQALNIELPETALLFTH